MKKNSKNICSDREENDVKKMNSKQRKNKEKKSVLKILGSLIKTVVILFLCLFAAVVCLQRFSNNNISILNYRMFSVATGSMVPKYQIGDVILCKEVDVNTLKVGDDITYLGKVSSYKDKTVTHKIMEIKKDKDGSLLFYTKGIASTRMDPVVHEEQIYGKIVKKLDFLSWLYKYITTSEGFYMCIFIPIVILIGSEIVTSMVERYEEKKLMR